MGFTDDADFDDDDDQEAMAEVLRERNRYRLGHASVKHPLRDPLQVVAYLDQSKAWATANEVLLIERMEPEHAFNAVLFLIRNVRSIALAVYLAGPDEDGYNKTTLLTDDKAARGYILTTSLGLALLGRAREEATTRRYAWQRP